MKELYNKEVPIPFYSIILILSIKITAVNCHLRRLSTIFFSS